MNNGLTTFAMVCAITTAAIVLGNVPKSEILPVEAAEAYAGVEELRMPMIEGSCITLADYITPPTVTIGVVTIDVKTGEVDYPEGLSTNEAAVAFWTAVHIKYPEMFEVKGAK